MPEPAAPLTLARARRMVPSAKLRLTEPINTTIPIRKPISNLAINLMVYPPVGVCDTDCVMDVGEERYNVNPPSTLLLLFFLAEHANALDHGPGLFVRKSAFKGGHELAFSVLYRFGDLFVGMGLLPLGLGEIWLSSRPPIG